MSFVKLIVRSIILFVIFSSSVQAQKNKKIDTKLWEYKDVAEIDSVHLHTYYKIDRYWTGSSYWSNYINTFESNGMIYFQYFAALPLYTETLISTTLGKDDTLIRYTREDTLMMFQNEDYSYRVNGTNIFVEHAYAWYGLVFEKVVSSTLTLEEREKIKLRFIKEAGYEIRNIERSKKIQYFERIDSGYEYESYLQALKNTSKKHPIIFIPKYESFVQK